MGGKGEVTVWKGLALGKGSDGGKEDSEERAGVGCKGGRSSNRSIQQAVI